MAKRVSTSPTGSARLARASIQASNQQFEQMENVLGADLMARLKGEHEREIECLWEEQLMLREELERIVTLMQTEILPREKQMHGLVEKMQQAWEDATRHVHEKLTQSSEVAGMSAEQRRQIDQLHDPMAEMEKELDRIANLLGHDIVKPDIRDWQQQGRQPGGASPSRMQPGSPSAGRTQIGSPSAGRTQTSYTASSAQPYQQRYQGSAYPQAPTTNSWQQNRATAAGGYSSTYNTTAAPTTPRGAAGGYSSNGAAGGYSSTYNPTSSYGESPTKAADRRTINPIAFNSMDRNRDVLAREELRQGASGSGSPYAARMGGGSPYGSSGAYPAAGGMRSTTPGRTVSPSGKRF